MSEWEEFAAYRNLIADAKQEERKRILSVLRSETCNCYDNCERIDTTLDELQTKIEEL